MGDLIVLLALAVVVALAVRSLIKNHKNRGCSGCSGGCADCTRKCSHNHQADA